VTVLPRYVQVTWSHNRPCPERREDDDVIAKATKGPDEMDSESAFWQISQAVLEHW
jgi:hypothetical protein